MASLGTLTLDLIAETGGFQRGLTRAERQAANFRQKVAGHMKAVGVAIAGLAAGGAARGLVELAEQQSEAANEADSLAKAIGTTAGQVQAFQYAAEQAGIGADKAGDILKDLTDKLGDASLNKGGELYQALQKIGISAADLERLNPTQQLVAIGQAIQGLPRAEQVNILESIADDGSRLLPILDNGAQKLKEYSQQAKDFGVSLSAVDNAKLVEANHNLQELKGLANGISNQFAIAMSPAIAGVASDSKDLASIFKDPDFQDGVTGVANAIGDMATGLARSVAQLGHFAAVLNKELKPITDAMNYVAQGGPLKNAIPIGSAGQAKSSHIAPAGPAGPTVSVTASKAAVAAATAHLHVAQQVTQQETAQQRAAESLNSTYKDRIADLQRQIALFGQTGGAAQLRYELENGELDKLSPTRKAHLESLQDELTKLQQQKQAVNDLFPAWQQLDAARAAQSEVKALPPGMQQAGQNAANRQLTDAATQGLPGMQGLDPQYSGAFGEVSRLNNDKAKYQQAYQARLQALRAYGQQSQQMKATSDQAIEALEQSHQARMQAYKQQTNQAELAGASATFGTLTSLIGGYAGEHSALYRGMFAVQKAFSIARAALAIKDAIASAMNLPFPANLLMGVVAGVEATAMLSGIGGITMGGGGGAVAAATGGIIRGPGTGTSDSIPAWLSNGEGVINARAVRSVGPDFIHALNSGQIGGFATGGVVGNVPKGSGSPKAGQTIVNIENHTDAKPQVSRRTGAGGENIIDVVLQKVAEDIRNGGGVGRAVLQTTTAGRRLQG